jgi:hypothetical protein
MGSARSFPVSHKICSKLALCEVMVRFLHEATTMIGRVLDMIIVAFVDKLAPEWWPLPPLCDFGQARGFLSEPDQTLVGMNPGSTQKETVW